jgi:hypothetical protein
LLSVSRSTLNLQSRTDSTHGAAVLTFRGFVLIPACCVLSATPVQKIAKNSGGLNLNIAGAKLMGSLGNAWGGHFYLSW